MQGSKAIPMTRSLLIAMLAFTSLIRMYGTVSFPVYALLQCTLAGLFVLSTSIYGALRIRNGDKENKSYMERIARYDALDAAGKMENQI